MQRIGEYTIIEKVDETPNATTYRARQGTKNRTALIKVPNPQRLQSVDMARVRHEYNAIEKINIEGIIQTLGLIEYGKSFALVLEDFGGVSLKAVLAKDTINIDTFLLISTSLAETLGRLHLEDRVLGEVKPKNIFFNAKTGAVKLAQVSGASLIEWGSGKFQSHDQLEEDAAYMSPEQTGRMARVVDYRTDFYSLGIVFYEMLTGRVPFQSKDVMEVIHSHIAVLPVSPSEKKSEIPEAISNIVMKLLSKIPEGRYQNAFGLKRDLERCERSHKQNRTIESFKLGRDDVPLKLEPPQKLFGRDLELELLRTVFDGVASGEKSVVGVKGNAGTGKTALVNELGAAIAGRKGHLISGRFEKSVQEIPYSGIIRAFQSLVRQLLADSSFRIEAWRKELLAALGPNGRVVTDVIPEVELIIGPQPELPVLAPSESQNRFNLTFANFARVFAKDDHILVLFLDDAHRIDAASVQLLKTFIDDEEMRFLLVILGFRGSVPTEETESGAQLPGEILEGRRIIELNPLEVGAIRDMIVEMLRCDEQRAGRLAEVVQRKTNGNPFFVGQFVMEASKKNLLRFSKDGGWDFDIASIEKLEVTQNVVDFMANRLFRIEGRILNTLKICACVGRSFDLELVAHLTGESVETLLLDLETAMREGLVATSGSSFEFPHDRIMEAAYGLLSEAERSALHLKIGRFLLETTSKEELTDAIFVIANHFGRCLDLLEGEEKKRVASAYLTAGQRAKLTAAYDAALTYFESGISLLDEARWETEYDLAFDLYLNASEAAFLNVDYEKMDSLIEEAIAHVRDVIDRSRIFRLKIHSLIAQDRLSEAVDLGTDTLRMLGISFPRRPKVIHVGLFLARTRLATIGKSKEALSDLIEATDRRMIAALGTFASLGSAAFLINIKTWAMVAAKALEVSVRHGYAPSSIYAYVGYGAVQCAMGNVERGYLFGQTGLKILEKTRDREFETRSRFVFDCYVRHFKEHLSQTLVPLLDSYKSGLETGDLEFSAYSLNVYTYHALHSGSNLKELAETTAAHLRAMGGLKQKPIYDMTVVYYEFILDLLGEEKASEEEGAGDFDKPKKKPMLLVSLCRLMGETIFGRFDEAVEAAKAVRRKYRRLFGTSHIPAYYFYDSLALLNAQGSRKTGKQRPVGRVRKNQKELKKLSRHAAVNIEHKYLLVEAELKRLDGDEDAAATLYEKSIELAHERGFVQEEALASEFAARFFEKRGSSRLAELFLDNAYACYARWGAKAKVRDLEEANAQLRGASSKPSLAPSAPPTADGGNYSLSAVGGKIEGLDLATVIKAARAISSEIVLNKLLVKLMRLSMENAGAEKGFIILEEKGQLLIEARGEMGRDNVRMKEAMPVDVSEELSSAIVNFVARTKETLIIGDASRSKEFANDIYILKNKPKSVLCAPIANKGKLTGVMYFENNLTTHAFARDRVELLDILAGQVAVSIENAKLYSSLTMTNEELEEALRRAEESARVKSEFLANTSHELRTPLNAIINIPDGLVEQFGVYDGARCSSCGALFEIEGDDVIDNGAKCPSCSKTGTLVREARRRLEGDPDEMVDFLKSISKSGRHLLAVVDDILDLSKLEAGRMVIHPNTLRVKELIEDVAESVRAVGQRRSIGILVGDVPDDLEIEADRVRLSQILINLAGNAVKFSFDGGTVDIGVKQEAEGVVFSVEDHGPGIAKEAQQYIFESFRQLDGGHTRVHGGTGLGLSITKKLIEMHGGEIWLDSEIGRGSTFFFRLPFKVQKKAENTDGAADLAVSNQP